MSNEEKILQILSEMRTDIGSINHRLDNLEAKVDKQEARFDNLEAKTDKLEQGQKELRTEFKYVVQVIGNRDDELRKDVQGIKDVLLRREQEEGRLLAILTEGHTGLRTTQDMQGFRISSLESASKRHDIEIAALKSSTDVALKGVLERLDKQIAASNKAVSL